MTRATVKLTEEVSPALRSTARAAPPPHFALPRPEDALRSGIFRARDRLLSCQFPDGYWCGELQGDTILESEYLLLLGWLGTADSPVARKAARYLLEQQLPTGGWALYPGGSLDTSASVKAYFALKLTGHDPASEPLGRARRAILAAGGADRVNSFTRFYLALLGQISYDRCPAVPPEAVLLPRWMPINIYRVSAWSRTILVPLSIMWAFRPVRRLPCESGIHELFVRAPEDWPPLHCPGLQQTRRWLSWESLFRTLDQSLKWCERLHLKPLRQPALRQAHRWMIERFADSDGLGAIFPPIIWSVVALKCLGYGDDSPEVKYCHEQLEALMIEEDETIRIQPCKSPVWDTAISLRALAATRKATTSAATLAAVQWLLEKEVRRPGDWSTNVNCRPAGWFFEHHNPFYPDVDDTIMVMMALQDQLQQTEHPRETAIRDACQRAQQWILAMQNRDGGWGAFDKDNDHEFLCHVPFADHNAMIDPSTPDITGRVLEGLGQLGLQRGLAAVDRGVQYLRATQEPDGSWFGRWGVNYIYGTWQVLAGLQAAAVPRDDEAVARGAQWLLATQQPDGGWGESPDSYAQPELRGRGPATPSQTAWAILGLLAAGQAASPAVRRGIQYLLDAQRGDGGWDETEFTGTGFPLVFYLRYHLYPLYFPLLALARFEAVMRDEG